MQRVFFLVKGGQEGVVGKGGLESILGKVGTENIFGKGGPESIFGKRGLKQRRPRECFEHHDQGLNLS